MVVDQPQRPSRPTSVARLGTPHVVRCSAPGPAARAPAAAKAHEQSGHRWLANGDRGEGEKSFHDE